MGSGLSELANQSRLVSLDGGGLKETGTKVEHWVRGQKKKKTVTHIVEKVIPKSY